MNQGRRIMGLALALLLLGLAAAWFTGDYLSRPRQQAVRAAPPDFPAETLRIRTDDGWVTAWLLPGRPGAGVVLVMHGIGGNREALIARGRWLRRTGYGVMLLDLPNHGESSGERVTYGWREAVGATAALAELRRRFPAERVGVIGISLGAAALVYGQPRPAPDAVVLESLYPDFDSAIRNRLRLYLGPAGPLLAPLLLQQLPLRSGITADDLRPERHIAGLGAPLLIVAGDQDSHATPADTRRLFAAAVEPKSLWLIPGASHEDLYSHQGVAYEERLGRFLRRYLR